MNIFEDLVEELKEENLLEETFVETNQIRNAEISAFEAKKTASKVNDLEDVLSEYKDVLDEEQHHYEPVETASQAELSFSEVAPNETEANAPELSEKVNYDDIPMASAPTNEAEFYAKRASEEVAGLQLVEHVFSGVEREQMKVVPKPFDDLECKKSLHAFMQVSADSNSPEHAQAEFHLMQETESWYSALSRRDRNISVTHLRRYCETTRPALSSTALISLSRFYRNSPFSEQVRSKYDLIITRLFTKDVGNDKRVLPFNREEFIKHLNTLYSQWASIPLYMASDDESEILLITLKFEEFMAEAESAASFDELIKNDFFNRLRNFKESTNENFFAPLVAATAIECNVRVGNRYVDLIQTEKDKFDKNLLEDKYGFLHDQAISESSSRTLQIVQLLQAEKVLVEPQIDDADFVFENEKPKEKKTPVATTTEEKKSGLKVNKWLLVATILIVVVNIGLYIWMSSGENVETNQQLVERVDLENSLLRDFVKEARIANGTFFGVVQQNWSSLDQEKKEDILKKIYSTSVEKGFSKAQLLDKDGKMVGYIDGLGVQLN